MKLDSKKLLTKLKPVSRFVRKYIVFMYFIIMLVIFSFLVFRINQFSHIEPSDEAVEEKLQTVKRPRLNKDVLETIEQLEGQNIQVQALFDQARNNPFNE